jgi:hypothetical protein
MINNGLAARSLKAAVPFPSTTFHTLKQAFYTNPLKITNLCLVFAQVFCIFASSNRLLYGKESIKQVCLAGGNHL